MLGLLVGLARRIRPRRDAWRCRLPRSSDLSRVASRSQPSPLSDPHRGAVRLLEREYAYCSQKENRAPVRLTRYHRTARQLPRNSYSECDCSVSLTSKRSNKGEGRTTAVYLSAMHVATSNLHPIALTNFYCKGPGAKGGTTTNGTRRALPRTGASFGVIIYCSASRRMCAIFFCCRPTVCSSGSARSRVI